MKNLKKKAKPKTGSTRRPDELPRYVTDPDVPTPTLIRWLELDAKKLNDQERLKFIDQVFMAIYPRIIQMMKEDNNDTALQGMHIYFYLQSEWGRWIKIFTKEFGKNLQESVEESIIQDVGKEQAEKTFKHIRKIKSATTNILR